MNWPEIFLGCFVVGFVLSVMSFAFGIIDMHVHFPWETHVHVGHVDAGHAYGLGPVNFATITAFVAWFGGAGYLLTTEFRWLALPASSLSIVVGVLGGLSQPVREGGIGELIYSQGGARKSCGARSLDGQAIEKGAEVVVTEYERGIASVRRWTDLASDQR